MKPTGRNYSKASEYWRNKINLSHCGTRQCHFLKRTKILGTACEFGLSLISLALSECMSHLGLNTNIKTRTYTYAHNIYSQLELSDIKYLSTVKMKVGEVINKSTNTWHKSHFPNNMIGLIIFYSLNSKHSESADLLGWGDHYSYIAQCKMLSLGGERLTPNVLDHYLYHDRVMLLLLCCFWLIYSS